MVNPLGDKPAWRLITNQVKSSQVKFIKYTLAAKS